MNTRLLTINIIIYYIIIIKDAYYTRVEYTTRVVVGAVIVQVIMEANSS